MPRFSLSLLSRLGAGRGSALPASSTLLVDSLGPTADGCATCASVGSLGASSRHGLLAQPRRSLAHHQYNLARPIDTNRIDELLASATALDSALLPVLRYSGHFDPEQVTRTLQRVPRMMRYQQRKAPGDPAAARPAARLLDALGSRLAAVAGDCSDRQLARALWAFGVTRHTHPAAIRAACEQLPPRLASMSPPHLATAAWGLAAAAGAAGSELREPVREVLQAIARHLASSSFPPPPTPATAAATTAASTATTTTTSGRGASASATRHHKSAASSGHARGPPSALAAPALPGSDAAAVARAALQAERSVLDHRGALQLAWAFAAADVRHPQALDVVAAAAAARITSQLREHAASASGPRPLAPRATYHYRTVSGWQAWPRPRPPRGGSAAGRPSRYLYDDRPRVVLRDYTTASLAPLLEAFARLGHRHDGLLQAASHHVLASSSSSSLRVTPPNLLRLLTAYDRLGTGAAAAAGARRRRELLVALTRGVRLCDMPAPLLAALATLAARWGVRQPELYDRIGAQLAARLWVRAPGEAGAAAEQAGSGERKRRSTSRRAAVEAEVFAEGLAAWEAEAAAAEAEGRGGRGGGGGAWALVPLGRGAAAARAKAEAEAAEAEAEERAEAEAREVRLEPRARFAGGGPLASWRREAVSQREDDEWHKDRGTDPHKGGGMDPRDGCSPAQVARLLLALTWLPSPPAAAGPGPAAAPLPPPRAALAPALLAHLAPHLASLPADAAADVALAAARLFRRGRLPAADAEPHISAAANRALYGSPTGRAADPALHRRILEYARGGLGGGGGGGGGGEETEEAAAEMRSQLGLSERGAVRLATAAAHWPAVEGAAVRERETAMGLALRLLSPARMSREALGRLVQQLRRRGRGGLLPERLLAAVGETRAGIRLQDG